MTFSRDYTPNLSDKQFMVYPDHVATPYSLTLTRDRIRPNKDGKRTIGGGHFVADLDGQTVLLPRAEIKEVVDATHIKLSTWQLFKENDILSVVEPYASITVGSLAINATVAITANNTSDTFTFVGSWGNTPTDAAREMATFINTSALISRFLRAVAAGQMVHVFARDGITPYTVAAVPSAGTVTVSPNGAPMLTNYAYATIQMFDPDDPELITLGAPAPGLPVGARVGIPVDRIYGLYPHAIDLQFRDREHIAPIHQGYVYEGALPYFDQDIDRRLTGLHFIQSS